MTHSQSPYIRVRFGIYHFVRRVPADVQQYYRSDRVSISLRTKVQFGKALTDQGYKQMRDSNGRYWQGLSISITG